MNTLNQNANENNLSKDIRPVYALTVEELKSVLSELVKKELQEIQYDPNKIEPEQKDIISIQEAADLTNYKVNTIYAKVHKLEIPVVSRCKPLMFSKKELIEWMKAGKPSVIDMQTEAYFNKTEQNGMK